MHRPLEKELVLVGADKLFKALTFPRKGITFLYGHRNPAIPFFLEQAALSNLDASVIDVHIEIGPWVRQKVDFSDDPERGLQHIKFFNVVRAKRDIASHIENVWVKELGSEVASTEDWPKSGGTRFPYLFDKLHDDPAFNHLTAIAYNVTSAEVGDVQVVTVFDLDAIQTYKTEHQLEGIDLIL